MSKKRAATSDINRDNWDVDDEPEEAGTFKSVGPDVLSKRVIKVAKRKFTKPNTEQSKLFTQFSGFGKSNTTSTDLKSTFSFLSNLNGPSTQTSGSSAPSAMPSLLSSSTVTGNKSDNSKPSNESLSSTKIKVLNENLVEWITKWVEKNPTCVLTPVFRDYEKHLETIKAEAEKTISESKPNDAPPNFKFNFTPAFASSQTPNLTLSTPQEERSLNTSKPLQSSPMNTTNLKWSSSGEEMKLSGSSSNNKPLFNFSSKPSFLQNVENPENSEKSNNKEEEGDDEPPLVNDFKPVTEDDALYSQRVKVFFKNNETFSDRGVGNLFIKEAKNEKGDKIYQAIVRADTALGNIIFNIRITKDIPTKRLGKNNVMLICVPTPETKPPAPVTVLLRVKTGDDADKLLSEINKYK